MTPTPAGWRKGAVATTLVVTGLLGGGVLASTVAANAADSSTPTATATAGSGAAAQHAAVDESKSQRSDEKLLTGTDAEKARAAALAKYPGATVQRVETDSDGVYEAHIVTADGSRLIVQMDKSFAVTGTDSHAGGGGRPAAGTPAG